MIINAGVLGSSYCLLIQLGPSLLSVYAHSFPLIAEEKPESRVLRLVVALLGGAAITATILSGQCCCEIGSLSGQSWGSDGEHP